MRNPAPLADDVDAVLPQTQCGQCGFDGCRPYAAAVAAGQAAINRCPPGGEATIRALARLTRLPCVPLDPSCGVPRPPEVAVIEEATCIGCTLCIQACPVDAIVGASQRMHTVIAAECTGCRLCLPPCPVDCIVMFETAQPAPARFENAAHYRHRHRARQERLERERAEAQGREAKAQSKRAAVERAMQRARQRLQERSRPSGKA